MNYDFSSLIGLTITSITGLESDDVTIKTSNGRTFRMYHDQDCCESVHIVSGTVVPDGIIGGVVTYAHSHSHAIEDAPESGTRTEFSIYTIKEGSHIVWGSMSIIWEGYSNGYYGEGVSFGELERKVDPEIESVQKIIDEFVGDKLGNGIIMADGKWKVTGFEVFPDNRMVRFRTDGGHEFDITFVQLTKATKGASEWWFDYRGGQVCLKFFRDVTQDVMTQIGKIV